MKYNRCCGVSNESPYNSASINTHNREFDEEKKFWKDNKGAKINSIKTKKSIKDCDLVIVKFGNKYTSLNYRKNADKIIVSFAVNNNAFATIVVEMHSFVVNMRPP